jgi:2-C-methyl-D-erythritol 4-phosphate cytidylyltransferase
MASTIKRIDPAHEVDAGEEGDVLADAILGDTGRLAVPAQAITGTEDRRVLMEAQTPQIFNRALLMRAYADADLSGVTDDAEAVERLGEVVHMIEGDPGNLKITTQRDLQVLTALLRIQPKARPAGDPFGLG